MNKQGFTIVELLIVIVVIGILAAITLVAYNGVKERANKAAVTSALSQVGKQLEVAKVDTGTYPANLDAIQKPANVDFQYQTSTSNFCITATKGGVSYKVEATTAPTVGGCAGHGVGGVAAITNLARNPKGIGTAQGWFVPLVGPDITDTPNVTWNGRSNWHRFVWRGAGNSTARLRINPTDLENGATYTSSVLLGNSGTAAITVSLDFSDQGNTGTTLQPGEMRRITFSASRATYDAVYSFLDIAIGAGVDGLLATEVIVVKGTTQYSYADGTSPNWVWNGAANASTSTGPPSS